MEVGIYSRSDATIIKNKVIRQGTAEQRDFTRRTESSGEARMAITPTGGIAARTTTSVPHTFPSATCRRISGVTGDYFSPDQEIEVYNSTKIPIGEDQIIQLKKIDGRYFCGRGRLLMARQLALGCRSTPYGPVHRTCCTNDDPTNCSGCKLPESVSIAGTAIYSSASGCVFPAVDGTYDWSLFSPTTNDGLISGVSCRWDYLAWRVGNCSVIINVGFGPMIFDIRIIYFSAFSGVQDIQYFVIDKSPCPTGVSELDPGVLGGWGSNSTQPSFVSMNFPTP